jgi:signal transduction histidine kinase
MQVLAQNALTEMRALIQQLHPRSIAEEGLAAGLRRLAAERQSNDGLSVNLQIDGDQRLPANIEEELFRVAQEALHNIVKHARTDQAVMTLNLADRNAVRLCIEDSGAGFDPATTRSLPGHIGLDSMSERIQALGGTLIIDSKPGKGTRLRVELALPQEADHV